jgi:hypothetical protein
LCLTVGGGLSMNISEKKNYLFQKDRECIFLVEILFIRKFAKKYVS